jgi:nickel-dependent lactate racemase
MKSDCQCISIPYGDRSLDFWLPGKNLLSVISPQDIAELPEPVQELERALHHPIGAPPLAQAVLGSSNVVILADDLTRNTPVQMIIPLLLDELNAAGISDDQVIVLIALGTHRPMSADEIRSRFGQAVVQRIPVLNNPWQDPAQMVDLGTTTNGTPVQVSRLALEADFLVGVGSIVPHHIIGFSGGAKIVQPGITGAATTGGTHYLSTRTRRSYLGILENPVRVEVESIAEQVGLKAIFNVVLDKHNRLVKTFYGHLRRAHRAGVEVCKGISGVSIPGRADIVVASSHPCDIDFWQAHKSLYAADLAVKDGGTIVLVTPCPEGVSVTHQEMLAFTARQADQIRYAIDRGVIQDQVSGALALAWARIRQRAEVVLISDGISNEETRALGFTPFEDLQSALEAALRNYGPEARVNVLTHAPETLPLLSSE